MIFCSFLPLYIFIIIYLDVGKELYYISIRYELMFVYFWLCLCFSFKFPIWLSPTFMSGNLNKLFYLINFLEIRFPIYTYSTVHSDRGNVCPPILSPEDRNIEARSSNSGDDWQLELETNLHEVFTITCAVTFNTLYWMGVNVNPQ